LEDVEKGIELGPEISKNVADSLMKTINRPLSKESSAKLRSNIKTPSNCQEFVPPKINNEIWRMIPSNAKLQDVKQQQIQQTLGVNLSAMAIITSAILEKKSEMPKEVVTLIVKTAMDAANLLGDQMQQINASRRLDLRRYLNPEYAGICTANVN